MKKYLALAIVGIGAVAITSPATARPHQGRYVERTHSGYGYQGGYTTGVASYTDRDGDGYDDRDTNYNNYIDPWEANSGPGGSYNGNVSPTDRNGDGWDDRDRNHNRYIDPWEVNGGRGHRGNYNGNVSPTDRNGDGWDDRDSNHNRYIDPWEYSPVRSR